jgi:hypothetical protein
MELINCPFLQAAVELTAERKQHIADTHPDLLPAYEKEFTETIVNPDHVRRSRRFSNALLFCKWFE